METIIPLSKILEFIGIGTTVPPKKDLTPPKLDLIQLDANHVECDGRKILLDQRDPNEPFPPGYEAWRDALRIERNCYVSRFSQP